MNAPSVHAACARCGATNRVPAERLADDPVCGRCRAPLLDGSVVPLTTANFNAVVSGSALPLVVDFWAAWCGPCRSMAPQFEQAARMLKGRALLAKVDTDAHPELAARFRIQSLPTLLRLASGVESGRLSGARPASDIVRFATG